MSLRMLDSAGVSAADAVIDVGGGASPLAGALLDRGFRDITVLDISAAGMQHARHRLGPQAGHVHWLTADVLTWQPRRRYQVWQLQHHGARPGSADGAQRGAEPVSSAPRPGSGWLRPASPSELAV